MTLILNYEGFEHRLAQAYTNDKSDCGYYRFYFTNGYGVSVQYISLFANFTTHIMRNS